VATVTRGGRTTTFGYGPDGYLASVTDPMGHRVTYGRDAAGRLVSQTRPDGTVIGFGYDGNGNLTRVTPPGQPDHAFDYTPLDLAATYVAPGGVVTGYSYNRDRQLTRETRPDGKLVALAYDAAGRLGSETIDTGTITSTYDAADRLTRLQAPGNLTLSFTYNGVLGTSDAASGAVNGTVSRTFDSSFRLTSRSVTGTTAVAQTYDADDLLTGAGSLTLTRDVQTGLVSNTALGVVTTGFVRNGFGEVIEMHAAASGQDRYTTAYEHDSLGRITRLTDTIGGTTTVDEYRYDAGGRLLDVRRDDALVEQYEYDTNGNRTLATVDGITSAATYDTQDRLLTHGDATFTHSAAGERLTKTVGGQTTTYAYDALGNLVGVTLPSGTQIAYLIDGHSRRVGKRITGALVQGFLYQDRLRPIAELDGAGAVVSRFVYGTGINVPDYLIRGGVTYRILTDHRGSPRLVVETATGAIVQRVDYDSFGNVLQDTNPGFQPFGFAGGLYDRDTTLVRFGARDYDAETGRWTRKDPLGFAGSSSEANLYVYADNDPVTRGDPDGLLSVGASAYVGVGAGARFAVDSTGFSVCVETGVGIGGGVSADPLGGLDRAGTSVTAQGRIGAGSVGLGASASLDDRGCGAGGVGAAAGPLTLDLLHGSAGASVGTGLGPELGLGAGVSAELSVTGQVCWQAPW
jgi:RHS repeat-associated protein